LQKKLGSQKLPNFFHCSKPKKSTAPSRIAPEGRIRVSALLFGVVFLMRYSERR